MVIVVVIAVVLAAVVGGYFALRPGSGRSHDTGAPGQIPSDRSGSRADPQVGRHDASPETIRSATPNPPTPVSPPTDDAEPLVPARFSAPGRASTAPAEAEAEDADVEDADADEYEIVEVIEYVEVEADEDEQAEEDDPEVDGAEVAPDPPEVSETGSVDAAIDPQTDADGADAAIEAITSEGEPADEPAAEAPPAPTGSQSRDPAVLTVAEAMELDEASDTEGSLAEVVADLIDEANPEVADVMSRLIDASDPELVSRLVDAHDLDVAEVVALLIDGADPAVAALVSELAEAPERSDVAEVLRLVDTAYGTDATDAADGVLRPEVAAKLEELDIEADLELTSRPGEMSGFAQLGDQDKLRVIIRVLCGLVGRDDLPAPRRGPRNPASVAERRMWPLSRARWPVPPPQTGERPGPDNDASLPARRQSTRAS